MTRPIPRYLLPHSCVLVKKSKPDTWGKFTPVETELRFVRIEPVRERSFGLSGNIPENKARLFYDPVSSIPADVRFETDDIIRFNGRELTVGKVHEFYAESDKAHHLEVELI